MSERSAIKQLGQLTDVRAQIAALNEQRESELAAVLTPEQIQQHVDIEMAYTQKLQPLKEKEAVLVSKIKTAVLKLKRTIRADGLMAVFTKPQTKWNTDKIAGYAVEHPGILQFKETGDPSVSIRKVK